MKAKVIIASIFASAIVISASTVAIMAQEPGADSAGKSFAARVAAILGLEETTVQQAFQQAREEAQDEALRTRLDKAVENGRLTQEQADKYYDWYQARPDVGLKGFGPGPGFGPRAGFHRGAPGIRGFHRMPPPTAEQADSGVEGSGA